MDIDQSRKYLKKVNKPEFHRYIDNELAGDFAVIMANDHFRLVEEVLLRRENDQLLTEEIESLLAKSE